ncbi:MFS transporter [Microbacterium sp. NPDC096154]|uniref:MFS transporter n=1 Tax=Microbacterium sp. NPDC096154 TaxID=3155549 RepID=UPI0033196C37
MGALPGMFVLLTAAFLTFFDRALLPPLIPVIARDLGADVGDVGHAMTAYVLAYAVMQLGWAVVGVRIGRRRTLILSTPIGAVGAIVAACALDPTVLLIGRLIAGAGFAATVPAVLTYLGDALPMRERLTAAANLAAALSLGMTVGTLAASWAGEWLSWRLAFAAAGAIAVVVTVLLVRLPEAEGSASGGMLEGLARIARNPWALGILLLGGLEGALLIGIFSYLPVALQSTGASIALSGLLTALFGITVIVSSQVMKLAYGRWRPWVIVLLGGAPTPIAYALLTWRVDAATVGVAAVLMGFSWAVMHTQIQTWMTDATWDARAVGMSTFAVALFGGGALGAWFGSVAADGAAYGALFLGSAVASGVLVAGAVAGRARYTLRDR